MEPEAKSPSLNYKERMAIEDPAIQSLYIQLSEAGKSAYEDEYLLSNSIFAKSDLDRSILDRYLAGKEIEEFSCWYKFKKVLRYFVKSFGWLGGHGLQWIMHRLSRQKFIPDPSRPLTIIDIPARIENIVKNKDLVDRFFPRLEDRLQSKAISYCYAPKFSGIENLGRSYQAFTLLKQTKRPVLSDFQMFCLSDYLQMFAFIPDYFVRVFRQTDGLSHSAQNCLLRKFLWEAMDHTALKNYSRQLFGRRISALNVPSIKCVSWYENQSRDKNFFRGLRSVSGKTWIYGAQLFNWPATLLNLHVNEYEKQFGLLPDCMLMNGTFYLKEGSSLDYKVGPSMRYDQLFRAEVDAAGKTALLVLMPFFVHEIDKMMQMINEAQLSVDIFVKFHPEIDGRKYEQHLQGNMQIVEEDLYALFNRVGCVIGKETGALVEAASVGIPVINLKTGPGLTHNFMPSFGKGIIWENASSGEEISRLINDFQKLLLTDTEKFQATANKYKKMLFCEPIDEKIDEAFGLNEAGLPHS